MDPPQSREPSLALFLSENYRAIKTRFPCEGRRKWRLRAAERFWALSAEQKAAYHNLISQNAHANVPSAESIEGADFSTDEDPLDTISDDAPGIGLLVRTDYSDDEAWKAFCAKLQDAEAEFTAATTDGDDGEADMALDTDADADAAVDARTVTEHEHEAHNAAQGAASSFSTDAGGDSAMDIIEDNDSDNEEDDAVGAGGSLSPIFYVVNAPAGDPLHAALTGISNLGALRLLNDVDVRRAPRPPQGTKRIRPPNRLVDHDGWQEIYAGKPVWVYDARSNQDQCVRLVSQKGAAMYGTATGDSWRARVSHICELQVNLASGAMAIDFGGLDRWDYAERARNMEGALRPVTLQQIEVNAGEQSVIVLINNQGPVLPAVDLGVCVTIRSVYVSQRRMMLESKKIAWVCR